MLLLIDNYDSFTYNLVHYLGELGADVVVRRNDALDVQQVLAMKPEAIVLSPGPCDPAQAGICLPLTTASPAEATTPPQIKPDTNPRTTPASCSRPARRAFQTPVPLDAPLRT